MNREALFGNALCHQKSVERAYELHCTKMSASRSVVRPHADAVSDFRAVARKFARQARTRAIVRDNLKLFAKLQSIQDAAARKPEEALVVRRKPRAQLKHAKLSVASVKPRVASVKDLARIRRKEKKILELRKTDRTVGHLIPARRIVHNKRPGTAPPMPDVTEATTTEQQQQPQQQREQAISNKPAAVALLPPVVAPRRSQRRRRQEQHHVEEEEHAAQEEALPQTPVVVVEAPRQLSATDRKAVYETRIEGVLWRVTASEPFTILTELRVSASDGKILASDALTVNEISAKDPDIPVAEREDDLQELLYTMFQEADINGDRSLSPEEFKVLMEDADLGLSESEFQLLMREVDENDDREINYEEFLPIATDLIQSFKARRHARKEQDKFEALLAAELDQLLPSTSFFSEFMAKHEFRKAIKSWLHPEETNRLIEDMPVDHAGRVVTKHFNEKFKKVKRQSLIESRASETEKLLLELAKESGAALLTATQTRAVLSHAKVGLSRLQITSLMCDARLEDGLVDYWDFLPFAAKCIERMHQTDFMDAKVNVLTRGISTPQTDDSETLARELFELFELYDTDHSQYLDADEFGCLIESLDLGMFPVRSYTKEQFKEHTPFLVQLIKERRDALLKLDMERIAQATDGDPTPPPPAQKGPSQQQQHQQQASSETSPESLASYSPLTKGCGTFRRDIEDMAALFRRADVSKEGSLSPCEFFRVLDAMDLGLTQYQKSKLLQEADENGDGYVSFSEFVPVVGRFLQIFRAKRQALAAWEQRMLRIEKRAAAMAAVKRPQLATAIHIIEHAFEEAAKVSEFRGSLTRQALVRCLSVPHAGPLATDLIEAIAERMLLQSGSSSSSSAAGGLATTQSVEAAGAAALFTEVVHDAQLELIKADLLAQHNEPESTLESHLRDLLREAKTLGDIREALFKAKHLRLSRQQLLCITSIPAEGDKFAACAAIVIADLFDVTKLKRRTAVSRAVRSHSISLLRGSLHKAELDSVLREQFLKRELNSRGTTGSYALSVNEFCSALQSIVFLDLSRSEITAILTKLPLSQTPSSEMDQVHWGDFLKAAPDIFDSIANERQLAPAALITTLSSSSKGPTSTTTKTWSSTLLFEDRNVLERQHIAALAKSLVARAKLVAVDEPQHKGGYEYAIRFFETTSSGAAAASDDNDSEKQQRQENKKAPPPRQAAESSSGGGEAPPRRKKSLDGIVVARRASGGGIAAVGDDNRPCFAQAKPGILVSQAARLAVFDDETLAPLTVTGRPLSIHLPPDEQPARLYVDCRVEIAKQDDDDDVVVGPSRCSVHVTATSPNPYFVEDSTSLRLPSLAAVDHAASTHFFANILRSLVLVAAFSSTSSDGAASLQREDSRGGAKRAPRKGTLRLDALLARGHAV